MILQINVIETEYVLESLDPCQWVCAHLVKETTLEEVSHYIDSPYEDYGMREVVDLVEVTACVECGVILND